LDFRDKFRDELTSGKKVVDFKIFPATDLHVGSHIPFGVPTGIPQLDMAIGRNGWPAGRIDEVSGFEHSGKSCAGSSAIRQVQRMGGHGIWIDAERSFQADWAETQGVDAGNLTLAEADTIEGIFATIEKVLDAYKNVDEKVPIVIVVDSVTSVPSQEMYDKKFGEVQRVGTDARAIRIGMRKLNARIAESKAVVIFINHSIANVGSPLGGAVSAGGHALKFNAGLRIQLARIGNVQEDEEDEKVYRGMRVGITVEKNRVGRTSTRRFSCFLLENGFCLYENLFDAFQKVDVLERVNNRSYLFKPTNTRLERKEWKTFVEDHSKGVDKAYDWFLKKAAEVGEITNYGGELHRP